ncbi:unnamed protein product [Phytomonas sp. Hart1]|nr:unnamed protein product [Phytomonas sp. Hart1]|eukprot:CCW69523.1 unnamed protein product [Phytomonas sp. isolate Hart1]
MANPHPKVASKPTNYRNAIHPNNHIDNEFKDNIAKEKARAAARKGLGRLVCSFTLAKLSKQIKFLLKDEELKHMNIQAEGLSMSFPSKEEINESVMGDGKNNIRDAYVSVRQRAARKFWDWMEDIRHKTSASNSDIGNLASGYRGGEKPMNFSSLDINRNCKHFVYWRLALPVVDEEVRDIQQYFSVVSFIILAVLSGSRCDVALGKSPSNAKDNALEKGNSYRNEAILEGSETEVSTEELKLGKRIENQLHYCRIGIPSVVVHCIAGKSRSAAIVVAFLLTLWMQRRRHLNTLKLHYLIPDEGGDSIRNLTEEKVSILAAEYVKAAIDYVQSVRLCVCLNPGFVRQLKDYAKIELLKG